MFVGLNGLDREKLDVGRAENNARFEVKSWTFTGM